ncbi:hypothetical protein D3C76_699690 [compost metagenome]
MIYSNSYFGRGKVHERVKETAAWGKVHKRVKETAAYHGKTALAAWAACWVVC